MLRNLVAGLCGYEVVAIVSGKLPTLTALDRKYWHLLSPVIIGGLMVHFYMEDVSKWRTQRRSVRLPS